MWFLNKPFCLYKANKSVALCPELFCGVKSLLAKQIYFGVKSFAFSMLGCLVVCFFSENCFLDCGKCHKNILGGDLCVHSLWHSTAGAAPAPSTMNGNPGNWDSSPISPMDLLHEALKKSLLISYLFSPLPFVCLGGKLSSAASLVMSGYLT